MSAARHSFTVYGPSGRGMVWSDFIYGAVSLAATASRDWCRERGIFRGTGHRVSIAVIDDVGCRILVDDLERWKP